MKNSIQIFFAFVLVTSILFTSCVISTKDEKTHQKEFNKQDTELVKAAILDYVEGLYLADSTRIDKSVDTKMRKIGYWYNSEEKKYRDNLEMTHTQLSNLAARWNKSGNQVTRNSPKKIEIFDVNTKTASAKLTAV